MVFVHLLFFLLVGHAFADYAGQGDFMAQAKSRHTSVGKDLWIWALPSHALIHGGAVALVTGSVTLGLLETVCHGVIDYLKCDRRISFHTDQALHVLCKVVWALLAITVLR